jgi:DNA primase
MIPWLEAFVDTAHQTLWDQAVTDSARRYLFERGVRTEQIQTYRLGWVDSPGGIAHCTPQFWEWAKVFAWNKIVFPLTDPFGQVMGVQLRSPYERGYRDFLAAPTEVCPPAFGLHVGLPAAFQSRRLVVVEGVFDYFAAVAHAPETVAILTSNASLAIRRLISRYAGLVVCLTDMDPPGRRGAYRLAGLPIPPEFRRPGATAGRPGPLPPYQVLIPSYSEHDPSDLWKAGKHAELRRLAQLGLFLDRLRVRDEHQHV